MLTDIYTDLTARISDVLDARGDSYKMHYGSLDDVLARAAVRKVTIAVAPSSSDWQVDGDSTNITLVANQFIVGVQVETVPDLHLTAMAIVDAIANALHGDYTDDEGPKYLYLVDSVSHGASTQSTDRYEITLNVETYYHA